MKLASYKDGSRDGQLVVVSRDLASAHYATGVATRLQQVLDDWNFLSPQLEALSQDLNHGKARHAFAFDPARCLAPLPRAFQWVDRLRLAGGEGDRPIRLRRDASDAFLAPYDDIACGGASAIDVDPRLVVIVGDVEAGVSADAAIERVRLVMSAAAVVERRAGGDSDTFLSTAFGPVAVTPDELAAGWHGGRVGFRFELHWNGRRLGIVDAGDAGQPHFGELVAEAAARRGMAAGSIVGSGPFARPDARHGFACLADRRTHEARDGGEPATTFLQPGHVLRLDMKGAEGQGIFGAVELRGADGRAMAGLTGEGAEASAAAAHEGVGTPA